MKQKLWFTVLCVLFAMFVGIMVLCDLLQNHSIDSSALLLPKWKMCVMMIRWEARALHYITRYTCTILFPLPCLRFVFVVVAPALLISHLLYRPDADTDPPQFQ